MSDKLAAIVIMGISGSGKTTVGELLARRLGWSFADADDFHPRANIEKMKAGQALNDVDRAPWLNAISDWLRQRTAEEPGVVTCSGLKRRYRDQLRNANSASRFVYLKGDPKLIHDRMAAREHPFMPVSLLQSQIDDLEEPLADEGVITVSITPPPGDIVDEIIRRLGRTS